MSELESRLHALRDHLDWPQTPAFEHTFASRPERRSGVRALAIGLAILLVIVAGALAVSQDARSTFLEIFRLRGATVERVEKLPEVDARSLDLGRLVDREEAEREVGFELLLGLGRPDAIYVRDRVASVVYGSLPRPRLVLTQLRGGVWEGLLKKLASSDTRVEAVTVDGERGLFISGDEHFVAFLDENGSVRGEQTYLAGTVLLWNRGELLLRLEGDLTRAEALDLAASVG